MSACSQFDTKPRASAYIKIGLILFAFLVAPLLCLGACADPSCAMVGSMSTAVHTDMPCHPHRDSDKSHHSNNRFCKQPPVLHTENTPKLLGNMCHLNVIPAAIYLSEPAAQPLVSVAAYASPPTARNLTFSTVFKI